MQEISYRDVVDKTGWGDGPWQSEPDKKQWQDEATGLPCMILRGPSGSWCGYVGVHPYHPAANLHYDGEPDPVAQAKREAFKRDIKEWRDAGCPPLESWVSHVGTAITAERLMSQAGHAIAAIEVHGGLTYASGCSPITPEGYAEFKELLPDMREKARLYPQGDAARWLKDWESALYSFETYRARGRATFICHVPDEGEPDDLWWFGFDCAHAGDFTPGIEATLREMRSRAPMSAVPEELHRLYWQGREGEVYRDMAYVEAECASLARQLKEIESA
jgi:hypothetical protein